MNQQEYENFKNLYDSGEYLEAISIANSLIEPFLLQDPSDYSESMVLFANNYLSNILLDLFNIGKQPKKIIGAIQEFLHNYIKLIVKLDLNEHLLHGLCECLRNCENTKTDFEMIQLSEDDKQLILDEITNPKSCLKSGNNLSAISLVHYAVGLCFSEGLFKVAIDKILAKKEKKENQITNVQLALMFRLFCLVEGFLNNEVSFTILPIFADAAINSLTNHDDYTEKMIQMLTSFIDMIPDESDRIIKLLCDLVSSGPVSRRLIIVKEIQNIVEKKKVSKKTLEDVKSTLLENEFDFSNSRFFEQFLNFLPILSKEVSFTDDDLIKILKIGHSHSNQVYSCISEIIPNVRNLNKFIQTFLDSHIYSPAIIFSLLSRIDNKQMSQSLFSSVLKPPRLGENDPFFEDDAELPSAINSSFESPKLKALLESKMKETKDPEELCSLSRIIMNIPSVSNIDKFINKIINLSEEHECLIPILMSFSSLLNDFNSEDTITFLFEKAYNHFVNSKNSNYLNQILPVLTEWFNAASTINIDLILSKMIKISYMKITSKFTPFVTSVIKRSHKVSSPQLKEFLLKIIYDTVPMRFSSWAIKIVFKYLHNDRKAIACIIKILASHLRKKPVAIEIFNSVLPEKPPDSPPKKTQISTRSRSRRSKKNSEYDDDESDSDTSENSDNSDDYDKEPKENTITLRDIITKQYEMNNKENIKTEKMINSIYLIERAAKYEADFFRTDELYGNIFNLSILSNKGKIDMEIGLHPYHTCRSLYIAVSKELEIPIDKFQLKIPLKPQKEDKLILSSTPISEIVEINNDRIELKFIELQTNISPDEFHIEPIFLLTLYNDDESINSLYNFLSIENCSYEDDYISPIVINILQLFEKFVGYQAYSPLQKVLFRNYGHPLDFQNNMHLFPLAMSAYSQSSMNCEDFSKVIDLAINGSFDKFSAVILMKAISRIECHDFVFTPELIKKGLIQNKHKSLRWALLTQFNKTTYNSTSSLMSNQMANGFDDIAILIPMVCERIYRENSKEFLECFKKSNLPKDVFVPYYKDLNQYETVNNIDQTFISLLELIPKNQETIKLTFERISVPPTVKNPQNPFVHSEKARKAAFDFLTTDQVYPILIKYLNLLPDVPQSGQKLADDFVFKGRNGIYNPGTTCYINTLMQSLNTATNVTNRILSLPTEGLSRYLFELREFMGQLKYARNPNVSIKALIDTIDPNFDFFKQADTGEFLIQMINKVMDDLKEDDQKPFKEELEITIESNIYQIGSDEKVANSHFDKHFYLSLNTYGLTNLFDSFNQYFRDYLVDDYLVDSSKEKITALGKQRVSKWPNYLIIQLQRWEFILETQERRKLVDEFGFPMQFSTNDLKNVSSDSIKDENIDYELSAILVHDGDIEAGHYFAIVNGDNGDWYSCDDTDVSKFDIANIPGLSFGIKNNESDKDSQIHTAYLLFYRRDGIKIFEPRLAPEFEERINNYNESTWPSTFFFSRQFLDFTKNLTFEYPNNYSTTEVALSCLFKIAIVSDTACKQWQEHIMNNFITNKEQCHQFFAFIKDKIGNTLGQLINFSDSSAQSLKNVILCAFKNLPDTTEPLIITLKSIDFSVHKRSITLACELITLACQELHVSWQNEESALLIMVKYVTMEMGRDNIIFKKVTESLTDSTESLIKILSRVVLRKGVIEPISVIYQNSVLERLSSILKSSESFKILTSCALSLKPSLISAIGETSKDVTDLLLNACHRNFTDSSADPNSNSLTNNASEKGILTLSINANFIENVLEKLCFCSKKSVRVKICHVLYDVMDDPNPVVANYIKNRVFDPDLICPSIIEESTFLDMLAALLPIGLSNYNIRYFNEFSKLLTKLCIAAPLATSLSFTEIIKAIPLIAEAVDFNKNKNYVSNGEFDGSDDECNDKDDSLGVDILIRFMIAVKHLVAFDDKLREKISQPIIETFLNLEYGKEEALQFVSLFKKDASGSPLFAACVSEALRCPFSEMSAKIMQMVSNGMSPGNFVVPVAKDLNNIEIATVLFQSCEKQRDDLKNYIVYILQHLKQQETWMLRPFADAVQMIENHYQTKIYDLMQ